MSDYDEAADWKRQDSMLHMLLICAAAAYFATSAVFDPEHRFPSLFFAFIGLSSLFRMRRAKAPGKLHD